MKEKFKNYGLWVSIFAFVPLLLQAFNINVLSVNYTEVVNGLLGILVLGGILSNPNSGTGYIDK